jgi:energy-coupling factor transporter ATP-binding protein EcfA2
MIEARGLVKRYGAKTAVSDLTFTVRPGIVTGFLGPNGSGKSTTMRMIIGLDRPNAGADGSDDGPPRPPGRVRLLIRAHPQTADVLVALGLALLTAPDWIRAGGPGRTMVHLGLFAPLAPRRRWPVGVFAAMAAVAFVQWLGDVPAGVGNLALLVGLYTVATLASRRRAFQAAAVLELGVALAVARWGNGGGGAGPAEFVTLSGTVTAALVLGLYVRNRRAHLAYLQGRPSAPSVIGTSRPAWPWRTSGPASPGRCTTSSPTTSR